MIGIQLSDESCINCSHVFILRNNSGKIYSLHMLMEAGEALFMAGKGFNF